MCAFLGGEQKGLPYYLMGGYEFVCYILNFKVNIVVDF
jgi:hypothetical protein